MVSLLKYPIFAICCIILIGGKAFNNTSADYKSNSIRYEGHFDPDTTVSKIMEVSYNEEDIIFNDYLVERLKPIRTNFERINSIDKWSSITNKELWETTEGGDASFYYTNDDIEKIITMEYGETFQKVTEYYFLMDEISFVIEKTCKYNRQIYYDSTAMIANNDTEVFDFEKSEVIVDKSYFEKGKLIHQICDGDCGAPFSDDYLLEEEIRIKSKVNFLIPLEK